MKRPPKKINFLLFGKSYLLVNFSLFNNKFLLVLNNLEYSP